ncbi:MAG: NAD(P)/FAD-dependent oxidoreductase [Pseudomonadota bacterium]
MKRLSIAIAGCGPAGLAAALMLDAQGHEVVIYDRFDDPGPVGSGLMIQPSGLAVLDRVGLAQKILARGARVNGLLGLEETGKTVLDAPYDKLGVPNAFGIGIHRASLFGVLYEAARAKGIVIETGHSVAGSALLAHGAQFTFDDRAPSPRFDLLVDASGWRTVFDTQTPNILPFGALWASVPTHADDPFAGNLLEQRYRRAAQMVGVLPIGTRKGTDGPEVAFFWSLETSQINKWRETPLESWKDEVRALWPDAQVLLDRIDTHEQLTFARYAHRTQKRPVKDRLITIGDAWHSASPQLGQGANMALLDAWGLAQGIEHGRTLEEKLRLAISWRRGHVWLYQWVTALFTPLYQSNTSWHPMLRDRLLAPLSKLWPASRIQAQLMSGLFGYPLPPLGLSVPDYGALEAKASRI